MRAVHAAALIPVYVFMLADQLRAPDSHIIAVSVAPDQACPASRQVDGSAVRALAGRRAPGRAGRAARYGPPRGHHRRHGRSASTSPIPMERRCCTEHCRRAAPGECAALADTIALIIERYWREVGYDAPPLQAPRRPRRRPLRLRLPLHLRVRPNRR